QLSFAERRVTIIPLHIAAGNFDDSTILRDAHRLHHGPDFLPKRAGVHPEGAADSAGNSTQSFDTGERLSRGVNAQARQRISGAHRNSLGIKSRNSFQILQTNNQVMMFSIVSQHVASGSERAPGDSHSIELTNE